MFLSTFPFPSAVLAIWNVMRLLLLAMQLHQFISQLADKVDHTPANRPDFIGTVPIYDFQKLQNSGRLDFLELQPVNISVSKVKLKT